METIFYQIPSVAGTSVVAINPTIPQFSGTATAEQTNTTYWIVEAS